MTTVIHKPRRKMAGLLRSISERFTPNASTTDLSAGGFKKAAKVDQLFVKTDPAVDGEECLHDCETCTIHYPRKFQVDEDEKLYGHVNGWATHLIVATGKTDWVRDVADEKGSVMEAVEKSGVSPSNGVSYTTQQLHLSLYLQRACKTDPRAV